MTGATTPEALKALVNELLATGNARLDYAEDSDRFGPIDAAKVERSLGNLLLRAKTALEGLGAENARLRPEGDGPMTHAAKHTPGPWKVYGNGVHPVLEFGGRGNDNFAICGECYGPNALFNQHLIAAAPELLQAGKHLAIKLAEVCRAAGAAPGDCQALRDWMAAVAKAQGRAAIAKAEGGE